MATKKTPHPEPYKTVLRLPNDLKTQVEAIAAGQSASINSVLVEAIRYALAHPARWRKKAVDQRTARHRSASDTDRCSH